MDAMCERRRVKEERVRLVTMQSVPEANGCHAR